MTNTFLRCRRFISQRRRERNHNCKFSKANALIKGRSDLHSLEEAHQNSVKLRETCQYHHSKKTFLYFSLSFSSFFLLSSFPPSFLSCFLPDFSSFSKFLLSSFFFFHLSFLPSSLSFKFTHTHISSLRKVKKCHSFT